MDTYSFNTPIGYLTISADENAVTGIQFGAGDSTAQTPLIRQAYGQLMEYFAGERKSFDLPVSVHGTVFQKRVWEALCTIPYGQTVSYGELAAMIGKPKAARAVGMANNKNALPILIPCHRVIGADGRLVGYAGGLDVKEKLLAIERKGGNI